jgi:hypothetical protein
MTQVGLTSFRMLFPGVEFDPSGTAWASYFFAVEL